jgi:F5/8 type C domain-containing protein
MGALPFLASVGEFFLLRRAERTVRAYTPVQRERVALHHAAGERRRRAARQLVDPLGATVLLREAILAYLHSAAIARGAEVAGEALMADQLAAQIPAVPTDPVEPQPVADTERARAAIRSSDPLYFDLLDRDELERTRSALDRTASALRDAAEARSIEHVLGARFGRIAGVMVIVVFGALRILGAVFWPDLAHGKPVTASSLYPGSPDGHDLVEGDIGTSYAIATNNQDAPWIAVDLLAVYKLNTVKIYNRVDGWFDDCLPVVLETSLDGVRWDEVDRRATTFIYDPPWTVHLDHKHARLIRVRALQKTNLALSRIAVFGSK